MGWIFEFCQYPELLSCDDACDEVFNIVIDLVICHSSDYDVVVVWNAFSAVYYEIQPIICQTFEIADGQSFVVSVFIGTDGGSFLSHCPSSSLPFQLGTIEAFSEIFGELANSDFGNFNFYIATMKNFHISIIIKFIYQDYHIFGKFTNYLQ